MKPEHESAHESQCGEQSPCGFHCALETPEPSPAGPALAGAARYRIANMDCAAEESEIRYLLTGIEGIRNLRFQLAARTLEIDATNEALELSIAAIRKAGFDPKPIHALPDSRNGAPLTEVKEGPGRLIVALVLAMASEAFSFFAPDALAFKAAGMAIAALAIGLAGFSTYQKGVAALRRGRLNINALMSVAVTGAFAIGQWPEAAMVMALYALAELIEANSLDRARNAIKGLLDLTPDVAEVRQADGSWRSISSAEVTPDDVVRVKPGARVPLDGLVTAGGSAVNQAPVTGESMPVDKTMGDTVFAGTINETGTLEFRVTAAASDTTLARIIHAVEEAQATRAPTQRFVDRFAAVYTPAVFTVSIAVAIVSPWLFGWTWLQSLYKALVLLVIACPCALVIATPVTVVSGLTAAARRGILIKGGVYLEEARKLRAVAMDKTGTITEGKPRLVAAEVFSTIVPERQVRQWAASLTAHSDHPVSKAVVRELDAADLPVRDFTAIHGRGVQGRVNGEMLTFGNHRLIEERGICGPEIEARLKAHEKQGRTVTMLATEREVLALFAVADTIKESSREAIAALHRLNVRSVMLTGDNPVTAGVIAREAGIDDARANLLPEEKLNAIEQLQSRYGLTAMAGDGINDAPALAKANIGVAMGAAGTDIAMEAADVVIMNDDLGRIAETILLSRRTHAILWQNIVLALGIKVVFLILALFGNATMWMAVFADMGASLLVVANGLRLAFPLRRNRQ